MFCFRGVDSGGNTLAKCVFGLQRSKTLPRRSPGEVFFRLRFNYSVVSLVPRRNFLSFVIEASTVATQGDGRSVPQINAFDDDPYSTTKQAFPMIECDRPGLADEAFPALLKKHGIPVDLKDCRCARAIAS